MIHRLRYCRRGALVETRVAAVNGGDAVAADRGAVVLKVATPELLSVPVPKGVPPSSKVTVPPGVPAAALTALTVAVKVTDCPNTEGLVADVTVVVVPTGSTTWLRALERW